MNSISTSYQTCEAEISGSVQRPFQRGTPLPVSVPREALVAFLHKQRVFVRMTSLVAPALRFDDSEIVRVHVLNIKIFAPFKNVPSGQYRFLWAR